MEEQQGGYKELDPPWGAGMLKEKIKKYYQESGKTQTEVSCSLSGWITNFYEDMNGPYGPGEGGSAKNGQYPTNILLLASWQEFKLTTEQ